MDLRVKQLFDLQHSITGKYFEELEFPWCILPKIREIIFELMKQLPDQYTEISENVWVGKDTFIEKNAVIQAPAIIGDNCQIRSSAFIRGNAIIGNHCVVGNSTEIKNAILFNNVQTPHFNYVGDSVLGYKAHIGAGVILSNVRSIPGNVKVRSGNEVWDTGLRKFGALLADHTEVGCNSVLNPGTIIGRHSVVYPLTSVRGAIPEKKIVKKTDTITDRQI